MTAHVKITKDKVADVLKAVRRLTRTRVLIGIPANESEREDDEGGKSAPIDNASLGYIMETGVPEKNIPARPFLVPGVASVKPQAVDRLRKVANAAFDGDIAGATKQYVSLGLLGVNAVRRKMTDGPFEPIADATKAARLRRRAAYKKASATSKQTMMAKYLAGDFRPLIDSGQLRNAVTFVVRVKGR